ncbi:Ras-related protein Rab-30 [Oopsacas minuta]|uniref:Ras-related protein Rab-30 n=1 Tax=Oopsacas minuta TaxID=111878 RepID=A0AAV7KE56_9METZ|nr:Ras-related protein Rab-30 [Oopsacas minuta]
MLIGYTEGDEGAKKLNLMSVNVIKEGTIWKDLLLAFDDQKIQYGYAKLDFEAKGDMKIFLIHWVGKDVGENEKLFCMPHLNEIRNMITCYDLLVNSMEPLDVQFQVHSFLSRSQSICVETRPSRSESNMEISKFNSSLFRTRASSTRVYNKEQSSFVRTYTNRINLNPVNETPDSAFEPPEPEETVDSPVSVSYVTLKRIKFKIAIIGTVGVGKTFIYLSYNEGGSALSNPQLVTNTIYADCMSKKVSLDNHNFTLEIWDSAGQERYKAFAPVWTRNARVVICVYDITDEDSYNDLPKSIHTAKEYADERAIFYLVGNKADLVHRRVVQESTAEKFAKQHDMVFMECSGLTGLNILKLFEDITRRVVFVYQDIFTSSPTMSRSISGGTIKLSDYTRYDVSMRSKKRHGGCQQCNK